MTTLNDAIEIYLARDDAVHSSNTQRGKAHDLAALSVFIEAELGAPPAEIALEAVNGTVLIRAFAAWSRSRPSTRAEQRLGRGANSEYSPGTKARMQSNWNGLFSVMLKLEHLVGPNPMDALARVKPGARAPKPLGHWDDSSTDGTIPRISAYVDSNDWESDVSVAWRERDQLVLSCLLGLGVRISELLTMRVGSFDGPKSDTRVKVLGKGDKERTIPAPALVVAAKAAYLKSRRERYAHWKPRDDDPLFVATSRPSHDSATEASGGLALTESQLNYLLSKMLSGAGVGGAKPRGALAHAFRHTFGTVQAADGTPARALQELMGHESLETTQQYIEVADEAKRRAIEENSLLSMLSPPE